MGTAALETAGTGLAPLVEALAAFVESFDAGCCGGTEAEALVGLFTRGEHLCAAGKTLAAKRAAETGCHKEAGHRTPAHWLASVTGDSVGGANGVLELGEAIASLPGVEDGFRQGRFSPRRAKAVSDAARANPASADDLVRSAKEDSLRQLKDRCARAKAEGRSKVDEARRAERLRRTRSCRTWTDDDGAFWLTARLTPYDGARVKAALAAECDRVFDRAFRAGVRESPENYAADALVALLTGSATVAPTDGKRIRRDPKPVVHLRVDLDALRRGRVGTGERCEIPGVGPIPVDTAREVLGEALAKVVITDGVDVATVCNLGRAIPPAVMTALLERDPTCVVPGCDASGHLEVDHWQNDFARGGQTRWANLAFLCGFHHSLKTNKGFKLVGGPGKWEWLPPRVRGRPPPAA